MKKLFKSTKAPEVNEVDDKDKRRLYLWTYRRDVIYDTFFAVGFILTISLLITSSFHSKSNIYFVILSNLQPVMAVLILILLPILVINAVTVDILEHQIKKRKIDNGNKAD